MYPIIQRYHTFRLRKQRRDHWDKLYSAHTKLLQHKQPIHGWIHEARFCLLMSLNDIAKRVDSTRGCIKNFERTEQNGSISLRSLQSVAKAMNCEFVYYFVPKGTYSFEQTLSTQRKSQPGVVYRSSRKIWKLPEAPKTSESS